MPQRFLKVVEGGNVIVAKKSYRKWYNREDWGALPPQGPVQRAEGPVSRVFFHYRSGTPPCYTTEECGTTMRKIQENHMKRRMGDIAFNFLVASGGNIYEGRGYGVLPPEDIKRTGPPGDRFDIAFIGDWNQKTLPYSIFEGGTAILEKGMDQGFLHVDWTFHAVILKKKIKTEEKKKKQTKVREEVRVLDFCDDPNEPIEM